MAGAGLFNCKMAKRDMKAVVVLENFWTWSGGFPQYLNLAGAGEIPFPSFHTNGMVKGINFWTYSGEDRPVNPGNYWKEGNPLLGDPPHELQGWYGVYTSDSSTLELIENYSSQINNLQ